LRPLIQFWQWGR